MPNFLIYGAYGYTGTLTAKFAVERGLKPIIAGRNAQKTEALAKQLGLPYRVFDLSDTQALMAALKEVEVVLHCAGPFIHTCQVMFEACRKTRTHYLDITGEYQVFEWLAEKDAEAKKAGIMVFPGTGMDVVPSDCLAAWLKDRMPDATHLELALRTKGGLSHGTATTIVENLGNKGAVREAGKLLPVPVAYKTRKIDFGRGEKHTVSIPWGDISTAYRSTGIPNIMVYMLSSPSSIRMMYLMRYLSPILSLSFVKSFLKSQIKKRPAGPDDTTREKGYIKIWGEVRNAKGEVKRSIVSGPEGYTLTALCSLVVVEKVLAGNYKVGYQTPATAYGKSLILEIEGTKIEDVD